MSRKSRAAINGEFLDALQTRPFVDAIDAYLVRQDRTAHPTGRFDGAGRCTRPRRSGRTAARASVARLGPIPTPS
jgi:hypothetical protein